MKKLLLIGLICLMCSGCFQIFAIGNNHFYVSDPDRIRDVTMVPDIDTSVDTSVIPK